MSTPYQNLKTIPDSVCTHGWTTPPECPSCMAIELESLRQENSRLREELERKESALKGAVFSNADTNAEVKRLREALRLLYDNQNGPPLYKYKKQWTEAMQLASEALGIKTDLYKAS